MPNWNLPRKLFDELGTAPSNEALLETIAEAQKADIISGDLRPMHRALRDAPLLVPLHEPPKANERGHMLHYITFEDDTMLGVFTDGEHLRSFFPEHARPPSAIFLSGQQVCAMAADADLDLVVLNPQPFGPGDPPAEPADSPYADIGYVMPPLVFRTLARGLVPGSLADEALPATFAVGPALAGPPDAATLSVWRKALAQSGARAAYWFTLTVPPDELRFGIAVEVAPEVFEALHVQLVRLWFMGDWPARTPLYVYQLGVGIHDEAIRANGEVLFPEDGPPASRTG